MYDGGHYMQQGGRGGGRGNNTMNNGRERQQEASHRKAMADTQWFWSHVERNRGQRFYRSLKGPQRVREEAQLFGSSTEVSTGISGDSIPVERSGPGCENVPVLEAFSELVDLAPFLVRNVRLMRYEKPTPIQKHSIPLGLSGLDLMCCAQTGSGKTFAFLLPVVACFFTAPDVYATAEDLAIMNLQLDPECPEGIRNPMLLQGQIDNERGCMPRAIVLAPTRELASQIHIEARKLCYHSDLKAVVVYGGADIRSQLVELSTGCDIIVATPGRLNDLVDRGVVSFCQVTHLVLDEADRMLDMGFEPQIRRIVLEYDMPSKDHRQTFMFSATFPDEIQSLAREFLRDYAWIGVGRVGSTVENIEQRFVEATSDPHMKLQLLMEALQIVEGRTLVFVQKKRTAAWVCNCLQSEGIRAEEIHGDRSQSQREHALHKFRQGTIRVLVATDVAARGLDVPMVMHVVQFDMPISPDDFDSYVHRIGRTGRAGKSGVATSFFVSGKETGEGNGKIAPLILRLLQENNQALPAWFQHSEDFNVGTSRHRNYNNNTGSRGHNSNYSSNNYHHQNSYGSGGGYGGGGGGQSQAHRFGGRDVRGYQSMPYASSFNSYPSAANSNVYQPHLQIASPLGNPAVAYGQHGMGGVDHALPSSSSSAQGALGGGPSHYMMPQHRGGPAAGYGGGQPMGLPYTGGSATMDGQQQSSGVGGYPGTGPGLQGSAVEAGGYNSSYSSNQPTRGGPVRSTGVSGSSAAVAAACGSTTVGGGSAGEEGSAMSPTGRGGMHGGYGSNRQQGPGPSSGSNGNHRSMSHVPSNYGAGVGGGAYDQSYGNGMGGDMSNEHAHGSHGHGVAAASTSMTRGGQGQGAGSGHYFDPYAASFVPAAAGGSHRYAVASTSVQGVAGVGASQSSAAGSVNAVSAAAVPVGLHDPTQMAGAHHVNYYPQQGQGQGQGQVMVINGQTMMMMGGGGMQPATTGSQMGYMGHQQYGQVMPMYGGGMGGQSQSMSGGQQHQHMYMGHPAGGRGGGGVHSGGLGQQRFDGQGSPGGRGGGDYSSGFGSGRGGMGGRGSGGRGNVSPRGPLQQQPSTPPSSLGPSSDGNVDSGAGRDATSGGGGQDGNDS